MTDKYSTKATIIIEANNGPELSQDFPLTERFELSFDATDLTIHVWVEQFKKVLAVVGYSDKTISEYFGDY